MPKAKFLNLDEIVGVERTIQIKGTQYKVIEIGFGESLKALQQARDAESLSPEELQISNMKSMVESVAKRLPDCPVEIIDSLSPTQIVAVLSWLNEPAEAQASRLAESGEAEAEAESETSEKKA